MAPFLRTNQVAGPWQFVRSVLKPGDRRIFRLVLPRIGRLGQYAPRPLRVPADYLAAPIPDAPPRISIVTPSYQQARFLERAVRSVVGQSYPALEYVVQDGGSTDGSVEILERLSNTLTRWCSEPDAGQADAINRAFRSTSGEIMAWLNSDDLLLPGALAFVAQYFVRHSEVDVLYGDRILIDEDDREVGIWILPKHDDALLALADYVPQETLFWRRRAWEAVGARVDSDFHYALDWDLLLRFRAAGARIVHVSRFLGAFRVHPEQKSTADEVRGQEECSRLRRRVHGRDFSPKELAALTAPYLRRHLRAHFRHRVHERLSLRKAMAELPSNLESTASDRG